MSTQRDLNVSKDIMELSTQALQTSEGGDGCSGMHWYFNEYCECYGSNNGAKAAIDAAIGLILIGIGSL